MATRAAIRSRLGQRAVAGLGGRLLDGLMHSCRHELVVGDEWHRQVIVGRMPVVFVLWHGRLLSCSFHYRHQGFATMITRNRDGDHITGTIERWGYRVIRGSSSRGGAAALRAVVRELRRGTSVALTPDGPRGPFQKMKIGPLRAAQLAGVPIVPVSAGAVRGRFFGRWDRFLVPMPFTWVPVGMGEPIQVERELTEAALAERAESIEERLNALTRVVDDAAAHRRG
jgi:lysophospholipid acyltransferase (LPLAT)-like uncharacterized protein